MPVNDLSLMTAKVEVTYGTYSAPSPATDTSPVFGYRMTPMESEDVRREIERGFNGGNPSIPTAIRQRHQFSVELAGHGTAVGVPHWAKFLVGAQFGAAVPGPSSVAIPLVNTGDGGSVSIAGNKGAAFDLRGRGARGNATFRMVEKALPSIEFDFQALMQDDANIITPSVPAGIVLPADIRPVEVSLLNTVVTLDGITLGVRSFELNMGNKVEYFSTTGSRQIVFGKDQDGIARAPMATCVFEMPDPTLKNYFPQIRAGTSVPFSLVHGTTVGNIIELASANTVLGKAEFTVEQNRIFMSCPLYFTPTAAGNDFTLITK